MSVFSAPAFRDHERVLFCNDSDTGLRAIVAVHSTRLGPAMGGCRMRAYESDEVALEDALRLSRSMTLKNALAGLDWGGGKAVVLGDPAALKTRPLLRAFGRFVQSLGGIYHTGEDVGTNVADMDVIAEETKFVHGTSAASGDPSVTTAQGVLRGLEAAVRRQLGRQTLSGLTVAVQGLGNVGMHLCALLYARGVRLVVADLNAARLHRAVTEFGARAVSPQEIHKVKAEIFAACALGSVLDARSVGELGAPIIAGSANNQLSDPSIAQMLQDQGRLYVPDFALNAGGVIKLAHEGPEYDPHRIAMLVDNIGNTVDRILLEAKRSGVPTDKVAEGMAEKRLAAGTHHPECRGPEVTRRAS